MLPERKNKIKFRKKKKKKRTSPLEDHDGRVSSEEKAVVLEKEKK